MTLKVLKSAVFLLLSVVMASTIVGFVWACYEGNPAATLVFMAMIFSFAFVTGWAAFGVYLLVYVGTGMNRRKFYFPASLGACVCGISAVILYYEMHNEVSDIKKPLYTLVWCSVGALSGLIHGLVFGEKSNEGLKNSSLEGNKNA